MSKCVNCVKEITDKEAFCLTCHEEVVQITKKQISDLEAKLAESEEAIKYLKGIKRYDIGDMLTKNIQLKQQLTESEKEHELLVDQFEEETEKLRKQIKQESDARKRFVEEVKNLKQQLAENNESHHKNIVELTKIATEKDRKIEELKGERLKFYTDDVRRTQVINDVHFDMEQLLVFSEYVEHEKWLISNRDKEIEDLNKQLLYKDKEISVLKSQLCLNSISQSVDQDKISFAVEQLEKVKEFFLEEHRDEEMDTDYLITKDAGEVADYLLAQIKQLKEGK